MDKSQLRRLALDFAQGNVDHDAYVRERTELIDSIVAGEISIEREAPEPRPTPVTEPTEPDTAQTIRIEPPPQKRLSPLHIAIGGALIACVVAAVFLSTGEEPPSKPLPRPTVNTVPPPSAPEVPAAKQLVDAFLDSNDWGATGIANFTGAWQALDTRQREEALSAPWFRTLSTALKQEINAQRALAGLDGGTGARVEGRRLVKFARTLGVIGPFPDFAEPDAADTPANAAVPAQSAPAEVPPRSGAGTEPPVPAPASTANGARADAMPASLAATRPANGQASALETTWLNLHADDAVTVQLFAVNRLDEVDRLMAAHPDLSLHVLRAADDSAPRFRVVKGPFSDASSARASYAELPDSLKNGQSSPVLRTVAELRRLLGLSAGAAPGNAAVAASAATAEPAGGTERFTLQLFASDQRDNVERLMASYPELGLRLHQGAAADSTYRVLFGDFASPAAASAAAAGLPPALLRSTGTPIIKRSGDPDGATVPQP